MKFKTLVIGLVLTIGIAISASAAEIAPISLKNADLGGGDIVGTPTKGVQNGLGLNNIGLLVKTWGVVTYVDTTNKYFYISDGAGLKDGTLDGSSTLIEGVRVSYDNLASGNSITPPAVNKYVSVTGISSTFADASAGIHPNLRPRRSSDIITVK